MSTFNERIKSYSELPGLKSKLSEFKFKLESLEKIKESVSADNYINLSSTNQKQINELTAKVELLNTGLGSLKNEIELDSQMLESENSILEKEIGELQVLMGGGALSKKDHDEKQGKLKQKIAKNKSQNSANQSSLKELDYYATYIGNESYIKHTYNEGLGNVKSKFSGIRPRTWISLGIIVLLVIAGFFLYNPVKEIIAEKMDWNETVKENTYEAYGNFISKYPASNKFQEAIAKQEDVFWVKVKKEISLDQIDHYISLYPSGIYLNEANLIKDSLIWSDASKSDNLNDYQNYINLFPKGKYSNQALAKITEMSVVNSLVDNRDGKEYKIVKIGNQVWMAENLAYKANRGCWAYNNNQNYVAGYGYLYDWETAKNVCPVGWHLPTKEEFETLLENVGGSGSNVYKELITGGNSGFSAPFGGFSRGNTGYSYMNASANFWSSSLSNAGKAWDLNIDKQSKAAKMQEYYQQWGFSVRCIKN